MRIRILPNKFDADPDPKLIFQIKAQNLEIQKKCSNRLKFHTVWLVVCKLVRIRIQLITSMRTLTFKLMRIRIGNNAEQQNISMKRRKTI